MRNAIERKCSLTMMFSGKEKSRLQDAAKISGWRRDSGGWARHMLLEIAKAVLQGEPKMARALARARRGRKVQGVAGE
jgi:hypothetical protein